MGLLILTSQCGLGWLSYAADWERVRDEIAKALLKLGKCICGVSSLALSVPYRWVYAAALCSHVYPKL